MEKSLWQKDNLSSQFESIKDDYKTDVLIIGAGMTGVNTCYNLIGSNYDVILIDKGKFFNGVTSKSTGKVTYLQDLKYQEIENIYGYEAAKLYYESQKDAIRIIKNNIKINNIDCNFQKSESVTFTMEEKNIGKFIKEEEILKRLNVKFSNSSDLFENSNVKRLISVKDTYVFNPIKYLKGLLKTIQKNNNIKLFENSIAKNIKKEKDYYLVEVNENVIQAKKIIIACNYPFFTIPGFIPLKTYLERSYITATKTEKCMPLNGITNDKKVISFRFYEEKKDNYFIYLSCSCKNSDKLNYQKNYDQTIAESKKITGKLPSYYWTNMDVMTNDSLPLIGAISPEEANVLIATGYNTWGMTTSVIASKVLVDILKSKNNKYLKVFNPSRTLNIKKIKNFVSNTLYSNAKAYFLNFLKKNPSWYNNDVIVTKINGKRVGIYYDEKGQKHVVSNICPHLKCFLTFNRVDKTWDCPCHGSRFDIDGNLIKGPSNCNIKIDETKYLD